MRELLENAKPGELFDFLEEYAKRDTAFGNALCVRFAEPDFHAELDKISAKIDSALDGASHYRRQSRWGSICADTSDITSEIEQRVEQGHIRLAFAELEIFYLKLLAVFEYQDECEISDEAESCLWLMSDVAGKAVEASDQEYIYEHCIDLAYVDDGKDCGADYEDKLLSIAVRFVTHDNCAKLEHALSLFETERRIEEFKLIRLTMTKRLDGDDAADAFIAANIMYPKIREIAYTAAMERQNYAEAERLCTDATTERNGRGVMPWLRRLYVVYERANEYGKRADTAERILLLGDFSYYDKLKVLLTDSNRWKDTYPVLLEKCAKQLSFAQYMRILSGENELELLIEQLKLHPEQIFDYGAVLAARYEGDVCNIFLAQIDSEAGKAGNRYAYRNVCEHITIFAAAGYAPTAAKLIVDYKLRYKHRPAFVDELEKLHK